MDRYVLWLTVVVSELIDCSRIAISSVFRDEQGPSSFRVDRWAFVWYTGSAVRRYSKRQLPYQIWKEGTVYALRCLCHGNLSIGTSMDTRDCSRIPWAFRSRPGVTWCSGMLYHLGNTLRLHTRLCDKHRYTLNFTCAISFAYMSQFKQGYVHSS